VSAPLRGLTTVGLLVLAAVAGCAGSAQPTTGASAGDAFGHPAPMGVGAAALAPGSTFGIIYSVLRNELSKPVRLTKVTLPVSANGRVARVVSTQVVPTLGGVHSITSSLYVTRPPVYHVAGEGCHIAVLRDVFGYQIPAGQWVRLYAIVRLLAPGAYQIPAVTINYTKGGVAYRQSLPIRFSGRVVAATTGAPRPAGFERPCVNETQLLPEPR
jgi:hypothetical protein